LEENKYNALSLWSLNPFPSMVITPGFEDLALQDVKQSAITPKGTLRGWEFYTPVQHENLLTIKKMSIQEKITFWQEVMQLAANHGIKIYIFTWNIYTYGIDADGAGAESEPARKTHGITDSAKNEITKEYYRKSVQAMVETYPLLA
jgi:hypothetical protein